MKPYMRDYRVGEVKKPEVSLAVAVAASSAFPPFLSPLELDLEPASFTPGSGLDLQRPPFTTQAILTDGGVYDNLGLETVWKRYDTVLVSDGGAKLLAESDPKRDWPRHAVRILFTIDNQVRSLRVRQLMDSFDLKVRAGTYWGIRSNVRDFDARWADRFPPGRTAELAAVPTRLKSLEPALQERLINWGYAICDAALRRRYRPDLPASRGLPYP
jgi:NTE family protein